MKEKQLTLSLEFIWWLVTAVILIGILYPILQATNDYPFLLINSVFVIVFITFTRYAFLLKYTFLAYQQTAKIVLIILCVPLILFLINGIHFCQTYLDENGIESFLKDTSIEQINTVGNYIKRELIFFGVGSLMASLFFPIRMIVSIWRQMNKGTE